MRVYTNGVQTEARAVIADRNGECGFTWRGDGGEGGSGGEGDVEKWNGNLRDDEVVDIE
jgi:hypothetical protein